MRKQSQLAIFSMILFWSVGETNWMRSMGRRFMVYACLRNGGRNLSTKHHLFMVLYVSSRKGYFPVAGYLLHYRRVQLLGASHSWGFAIWHLSHGSSQLYPKSIPWLPHFLGTRPEACAAAKDVMLRRGDEAFELERRPARPGPPTLTKQQRNVNIYSVYIYELQPKFTVMESSTRDICIFWNWAGAWKTIIHSSIKITFAIFPKPQKR